MALARRYGMKVLVDEAHGTHFYFGEGLPVSAMASGADMAAVSMHKTGGSLTQSSFLLCGPGVNDAYVRQVINLTQTTSGSYLLMVSLDLARRNLSLHGREIFRRTLELAAYAREEIAKIGGYVAFDKAFADGGCFYDFDMTKLSIHTRDIGLAGVEVYDILRDEYGIQTEFGDIGNLLAVISAGDRALELERLIGALSEIKRLYARDPSGMPMLEYIPPQVVLAPQKAFYGEKRRIPTAGSAGRICGEFVMAYPAGYPHHRSRRADHRGNFSAHRLRRAEGLSADRHRGYDAANDQCGGGRVNGALVHRAAHPRRAFYAPGGQADRQPAKRIPAHRHL